MAIAPMLSLIHSACELIPRLLSLQRRQKCHKWIQVVNAANFGPWMASIGLKLIESWPFEVFS